MKTADDLFEELGFIKKEGPTEGKIYRTVNCYEKKTKFGWRDKTYRITFYSNRKLWNANFATFPKELTFAIIMKIKELGWYYSNLPKI